MNILILGNNDKFDNELKEHLLNSLQSFDYVFTDELVTTNVVPDHKEFSIDDLNKAIKELTKLRDKVELKYEVNIVGGSSDDLVDRIHLHNEYYNKCIMANEFSITKRNVPTWPVPKSKKNKNIRI